jgi:hypothetical protein
MSRASRIEVCVSNVLSTEKISRSQFAFLTEASGEINKLSVVG